MNKKISVISHEWPIDMLSGLVETFGEDLEREGIGRIAALNFSVDPDRDRALVDVVGEVCKGKVVFCIFMSHTNDGLQKAVNSWLVEEAIEEFKVEIARFEGRVYIAIAGRKT